MSAKPKLLAPISTVTDFDVVGAGEGVELDDLAATCAVVVPVETGLEVAAGLRVGAGARARQVERA